MSAQFGVRSEPSLRSGSRLAPWKIGNASSSRPIVCEAAVRMPCFLLPFRTMSPHVVNRFFSFGCGPRLLCDLCVLCASVVNRFLSFDCSPLPASCSI